MMKVVLFDKLNATRVRVEDVVEVRSEWMRVSGHMCRMWWFLTADGFRKTYKQRHYEIERIEIQP